MVQAPQDEVEAWVRTGIVPAQVVPAGVWTLVVPAGPSRASAPYDDALTVLANRAVPASLGRALGFYAIGGRGIVVVHEGRRGRRPRWIFWEPRFTVETVSAMPAAHPDQLVTLADTGGEAVRRAVHEVLSTPGQDPVEMLQALVRALRLPGADLVGNATGAALRDGAVSVEPDPKHLRWFRDAVRDGVAARFELEDKE